MVHLPVLNNSVCIRPQNDSMSALSWQSPTAPTLSRNPWLRTFVEKTHAVNSGPRSAMMIGTVVKAHLRKAVSIVELTSVLSALLPITEHIALREYELSMIHAKTRLWIVGRSFMSVTHNLSMVVRLNFRLTKSLVVRMLAISRRGEWRRGGPRRSSLAMIEVTNFWFTNHRCLSQRSLHTPVSVYTAGLHMHGHYRITDQ